MFTKAELPGPLRNLSQPDLARRLDELIVDLGEDQGTIEQQGLLMELQAHQIELELQSRGLQ